MLPRTLLIFSFNFIVTFAYPDTRNQYSTMNQTRASIFCYINGTRLSTNQAFNIKDIKAELCTYIVFGALIINRNGGIDDRDHKNDFSQNLSELLELKRNHHHLKIIISIRGNSADFSYVAQAKRPTFVNAVDHISESYDGVNIDWQYPTRAGGQAVDKQNFVQLLEELKEALRNSGKLLTATISQQKQNIIEGYDYINSDLLENVDYWFIMATEYYNHGSHIIGANAPIRSRLQLSVEKTVNDITDMFHNNAYKFILIIPLYGKKYQLENVLNNHSPIGKTFTNKHESPASVFQDYRSVCKTMIENHYKRGWDLEAQVPYLLKDRTAIIYEDAQSVQAKTSLALRKSLGGVMVYSIDMDDYSGTCSSTVSSDNNRNMNSPNRFPLLQAVYDTVERGPNSAAFNSSPLVFVIVHISASLIKLFDQDF